MYRISITGPECTGKTSLASRLALFYKEPWVEEYAREYLSKLNRAYEYDDLLLIAKGQIKMEKRKEIKSNKFLFCDTDILVLKVWSEYVYGKTDKWIDYMLLNHKYDLYLLCYPDIKWEYDKLRENPENREELFYIYKSILDKYKFNYAVIKGNGEERFKNAIVSIETYLK